MQFTHEMFMQAVQAMREQGIIKHSVALHIRDGWYAPERFYWRGDETTDREMIYGPIYHNDNLI